VAYALMAATFGLLIAALGKTPGGTRGVAILASLLMVMLGGAWVPAFIFPPGCSASRWRFLSAGRSTPGRDDLARARIDAAIMPTLVLLGFSLLFGALALARFRWEEA